MSMLSPEELERLCPAAGRTDLAYGYPLKDS